MELPTVEQTAKEHRAADAACGRSWSCACGACRRVRELETVFDCGCRMTENDAAVCDAHNGDDEE